MFGAIIGDIIGSQFEGRPAPGKGFEFFTPRCRFTDDTLMTLAIADAIMQSWQFVSQLPSMETTENASPLDYPAFHEILAQYTISCMQKLGRAYPNRGFGGSFIHWIFSDEPKPYNSFGNGAAMRVSPVAYIARSEAEVLALAKTVTEVTHNHPEGIKGAQATALAIWYGLADCLQSDLRHSKLMDFYPDFQDVFFIDIDDSFPRDISCQRTVPFALLAFLDSDDFEGAIRNAISLGGDTDTLAAITGSIAEAYFPVPPEFILSAYKYLDQTLIDIITKWHGFLKTFPNWANFDYSWIPAHIMSPMQAHNLQHFHLELRFYYPSKTEKQTYIAETLTLNDDENELSFTFNKPALGEIQHNYRVNKGLDSLFKTASGLLKSEGWVDTPINSDDYFRRFFKLTAKTKDGKTIHRQGILNRAHVPEWSWRTFASSISKFISNFGITSIFWEDAFLSAKKPGELMVCNVRFNNYGKNYQYLCDDESISPGDYVLVPVGFTQVEKVALVESIRFYKAGSYAPYPLDRTKKILRKLNDSELNQYDLPDD